MHFFQELLMVLWCWWYLYSIILDCSDLFFPYLSISRDIFVLCTVSRCLNWCYLGWLVAIAQHMVWGLHCHGYWIIGLVLAPPPRQLTGQGLHGVTAQLVAGWTPNFPSESSTLHLSLSHLYLFLITFYSHLPHLPLFFCWTSLYLISFLILTTLLIALNN